MSVNKVILMGRLGKDPEITTLQSGAVVAKFSLATSKKYKDRSGAVVENTEWHNIEAWDKLAEVLANYAHKGDMIYLEGEIRTDKWQDDSGNNRFSTKIRMTDLTLMPKSEKSNRAESESESESELESEPKSESKPKSKAQKQEQEPKPRTNPKKEISELDIAEAVAIDDLPF